MFGLFKSKSEAVDELVDEITSQGTVKPVEVPSAAPKPPVYEIGKTEDNKVTFTMRHAYGSTTITMTNAGVDTLVRMLESAKDPEEQDDEES